MVSTLALILALQVLPTNGVMVVYSEVDGQQWKSVALGAEVDRTPPWHASDEATPLSPNAAIHSATVVLSGLVSNPVEWQLRSVTLFPVGQTPRGIYQVEFHEIKPGIMMDGRLQTMKILVLMSGVAIVPVPTQDDLAVPELRNSN